MRKIKFKYKFDDSFSPVYTNGVIGGPTVRNEIVINFFIERNPIPYETTHELDKDGKIGAIIEHKPEDKEDIVLLRKINTGVIMDLQTAKELLSWLESQIKMAEKRKIENDSK